MTPRTGWIRLGAIYVATAVAGTTHTGIEAAMRRGVA
jgi:hypothetical protein